MADYLMDIVYYYPYKAYDIIRNVIGFVWAKNKENVNKSNIINSLYFSIRDFNICLYLKTNIEESKRKLTLEEFKEYTVELFKNSIYDLQSIKNAIEEIEEFSFDANISIAIQDIEALNLDNLYQIIVEVFEWIYRKKMNLDNIERIEIIKKLEKLLEKYEKDV